MWLVIRAPFLPMGSLAICTRISWPSLGKSLLSGIGECLRREFPLQILHNLHRKKFRNELCPPLLRRWFLLPLCRERRTPGVALRARNARADRFDQKLGCPGF